MSTSAENPEADAEGGEVVELRPKPTYVPDTSFVDSMRAVENPSPTWWKRMLEWLADDSVDIVNSVEKVARHDSTTARAILREYPQTFYYVPERNKKGSLAILTWGGWVWELDLGTSRMRDAVDLFWRQTKIALERVERDHVARTDVSDMTDAEADTARKKARQYVRAVVLNDHWLFWNRLGNNERRNAVVREFCALSDVVRGLDEFDADPSVLVLRNGVLELGETKRRWDESGEWRVTLEEHESRRKVTMWAAVDWNPEACGAGFKEFIEQVLPDAEVRWYLQKALGSALLGTPQDRIVLSLIGPAASGKSTLLELIENVLGAYAKFARASLFTIAKNQRPKDADAPTPALGAHRLTKLLMASESDKGSEYNGGLLKGLTGRDTQTTRQPHGTDEVEWKVRFTIVIATNKPIKLDSSDFALVTRIVPVEFPTRFKTPSMITAAEDISPEELADKEKARTILAVEDERSAILNWLLEGLRGYLAEGLEEPEQIRELRKQMLANMSSADAFKQFLAEMGLVSEVAQSVAKSEKTGVYVEDAFAVYEYWFEHEGMHDYWPSPLSRTQVRDALASEWSTTGRVVKFRSAGGKHGFDMIRWTDKGEAYLEAAREWAEGVGDEGLGGLHTRFGDGS